MCVRVSRGGMGTSEFTEVDSKSLCLWLGGHSVFSVTLVGRVEELVECVWWVCCLRV